MKLNHDCIPCLLRQALDTGRRATTDPEKQEAILRAAATVLATVPYDQSAPQLAQRIYASIREISGNDDPYRVLKKRCNELALQAYPQLLDRISRSDDPFGLAVRFSIAGNIIDFGAPQTQPSLDLLATAETVSEQPLAIDHLGRLAAASKRAKRVLYFGDNAGEIVFDRLLIEQLGPERISFVVRAGPIINDATTADAEQAGLSELVDLLNSGSDVPGIVLEQAPEQVRRLFAQADLVIAKGQGNFETLSEHRRAGLFFLLKIKCPVVARHLGCDNGGLVVMENA